MRRLSRAAEKLPRARCVGLIGSARRMVTVGIRDEPSGPHNSLFQRFAQPYYVLRPVHIFHRLIAGRQPELERIVRLPWGLEIAADPREGIGRAIIRNGLFDLTVSEALSRLLGPGETSVDVGANIGHMTSIMARRAGTRGRVIAFEPHPDVNRDLAANVARWRTMNGVGAIEVHTVALSDEHGSGTLFTQANFAYNRGLASFEAPSGPTHDGWATEDVTLKRLDQVVEGPIALIKIDVEGHELQVLRGATALLEEQLVRDIIFEEHGRYPTPVTELLEDLGFTLFWLDRSFSGPRLRRPGDPPPARNGDPSFVASIDPERVRALLAPRGWRALGWRTISMGARRAVE